MQDTYKKKNFLFNCVLPAIHTLKMKEWMLLLPWYFERLLKNQKKKTYPFKYFDFYFVGLIYFKWILRNETFSNNNKIVIVLFWAFQSIGGIRAIRLRLILCRILVPLWRGFIIVSLGRSHWAQINFFMSSSSFTFQVFLRFSIFSIYQDRF